jgi:hypothetical protein
MKCLICKQEIDQWEEKTVVGRNSYVHYRKPACQPPAEQLSMSFGVQKSWMPKFKGAVRL